MYIHAIFSAILFLMSESYVALYRKYRPNTFSDVVGQEHIVSVLVNSINDKKISHAYLFSGGRGTGKTSVARILAREIGCNPEDIIEIDAASNRGIDEIRELRDAVRTAPFSSPYKVYIIDEAHMLTKEAANALLKTLEEPPQHVIFILATTDPDKLPETILSRCQHYAFRQPTHEILAKRLMYVADKEGRLIDEATAQLIASFGKGSYRDALGVLEQVLALHNEKTVSHEHVSRFLGVTEKDTCISFIESIGKGDAAQFLATLVMLKRDSHDALAVFDQCLAIFREGLLARIGEKIDNAHITSLAQAYPYCISSKTVLELLAKRHLITVAPSTAWTAFEAIFAALLEESKK